MIDSIPVSNLPECKIRQYRKRKTRCYEIGGNFILDNPAGWVLVHATVGGIPHCFVENDTLVYDPQLNRFYDNGQYYTFFSVIGCHKYGAMDAAKTMVYNGHWGPW